MSQFTDKPLVDDKKAIAAMKEIKAVLRKHELSDEEVMAMLNTECTFRAVHVGMPKSAYMKVQGAVFDATEMMLSTLGKTFNPSTKH